MKQFLLFCIFQLFLFSVIGQEKRLALVIGNANYNEATLDNPINDAILMKETFLKLGFEVVLFTDIETYSEFLSIIDNYNNKRKDYSVGFIYYAGHAVQIGGVNYMLATKEKYESESNIKYKGVNISIFTDEWENPYENELNVLILDACRNNPFEKKIYGDTRTIGKEGLGLAEIDGSKQPTGSIVAFSTAAGKTASDGKEGSKNSLYCQSLSTNLQLEDVSIRNIFGKVSKEIYIATNQYPVVSDKMFDVDFYLKKSTYIDQIIEIDSLIENDNFDFANEKTLIVLGKSPNNKATLLRKGRIEYLTKNSDYNGSHLFKADSLYPNDPEVHEYLGRYYSTIGEVEKGIKYMNRAIDLDSQDPELFYWRARFFEENNEFQNAESDYTQLIMLDSTVNRFVARSEFFFRCKEYELALQDYTKVIALDKENPKSYDNRADCYIAMNENTSALKDLDKAIDLAPDDAYYYNNRADFYKDYKTEYKLALKDYETALDISTDAYETIRALNNRASIFEYQEKFDLALEEYNKAIDKSPEEPLIYSNRANIYKIQEKYELALQDYTQAIVLEPTNPNGYADRASFYKDELKRPYDALVDYSLAISIDSGVVYNWFMRGLLFSNELKDHKSAIRDFQNILKLDSNDVSVLNWLGVFYGRLGEDSLELEFYNRTIQKDGVVLGDTAEFYSSLGWAYNNLAYAFQKQNNNLQSLKYYNRAVELDPTEVLRYYERAWFHALYINNYDAAIQDINCALKMDERNPYWHLQRAKINLLANNSKDAKKDFVKAAEMSNDSEVYKVELANYFSIIGDNKNAEKNFINVLDNESLNSHYLHIKTSHLMRIKLWAEATENALKAIKMNEKDTMSYFQLGSIYLSTNQYQKALNAFLKAENIILLNDQQKEIDESDESQIFLSDIQYEILNLYLLLNESELACSYFNKAISTLEIETRSKKELINKKFKQKGIICQN